MTNQQEDAELDIVNEILRRHDHENDGQTIDADLIKAHTNKAIGEVLDRLRLYAVYGEYDKAEDDSEQGEVVPVMVIEAERNKLKESTDD